MAELESQDRKALKGQKARRAYKGLQALLEMLVRPVFKVRLVLKAQRGLKALKVLKDYKETPGLLANKAFKASREYKVPLAQTVTTEPLGFRDRPDQRGRKGLKARPVPEAIRSTLGP
jgi:hypothetical protein